MELNFPEGCTIYEGRKIHLERDEQGKPLSISITDPTNKETTILREGHDYFVSEVTFLREIKIPEK